jgi:hypothetical protein
MKITRRKSLAALAAATAIVLVYGAWHGPWCWDKLAAALRNAGHEVTLVDLQGAPTGRAPVQRQFAAKWPMRKTVTPEAGHSPFISMPARLAAELTAL